MALQAPNGMPNVSGLASTAPYMSNMQKIISDEINATAAQQVAEDNRVFRQAQLANEGTRLGMLNDKNAYDMQGGARDIETARVLAGVNAQKEITAADAATTLRGAVRQEELDAGLASTQLANEQRTNRTALIDEATGGQVFNGFSDSTIKGVEDNPIFQSMYATQHPSDKTDVPQQQAFMNQMLSDIQANPASYEDPNVIIRNVNELADSEGWDDATRKSAMDEALRDFTKLDSATAESQQQVVNANQDQIFKAITGNSANGNTGSKAQQNLIEKMYQSGDADKQQQYLKDWIDLHGNKQGESSNTTKLVEFAMPSEVNEKDASGANIQPLFAHFAGDDLTIPAIIQSLEGLGLVQGGSYTSMEPQEMLSDPVVLEQIKALAQDFQGTSGKGSGKSLSEVVGLVKASQGDAAAERNRINGNQVFRQNTDGNRLSYILGQLPGRSGAKTRAEAVRNTEKVVDPKILSGSDEVLPPAVVNAAADTSVFSSSVGRPRPSIGGLARRKLEEAADLERLSNLSPTRRTRSR
jgi:hypothetical protein